VTVFEWSVAKQRNSRGHGFCTKPLMVTVCCTDPQINNIHYINVGNLVTFSILTKRYQKKQNPTLVKQCSPATRHGGAGGGEEYSSYSFLTSALDGVSGQRQAPVALCPGERTPGTHCTGGWVSPRAGLDTEVRGKIPCPCRRSNPDRPVVQSVVKTLYWLSYPAPTLLL
jgi:hypothetical protein